MFLSEKSYLKDTVRLKFFHEYFDSRLLNKINLSNQIMIFFHVYEQKNWFCLNFWFYHAYFQNQNASHGLHVVNFILGK